MRIYVFHIIFTQCHAITEPKNAIIKQYKRLLGMDGVKLEFTDDAILAIADRAIRLNTGARGLRSSMDKIMNRLMFEAPDLDVNRIIVDKDTVENGAVPKYLKDGAA